MIQKTLNIFDKEGKPEITYHNNIWYYDSCIVEKITGINIVTKSGVTTMSYPLRQYRYYNPHTKTVFDYKSFSDTAIYFDKFPLPDSLTNGREGWNVFSEKAPVISGEPVPLTDTVIDKISYKRYRFNYTFKNPGKGYLIGLFRCDNKGTLFSLEKKFSRKINCTLVKLFDYRVGREKLYASTEVFFISDTLSDQEMKAFKAWGKTAVEDQRKN